MVSMAISGLCKQHAVLILNSFRFPLHCCATASLHSGSDTHHFKPQKTFSIVLPGKVSPLRTVPDNIPKPLYALSTYETLKKTSSRALGMKKNAPCVNGIRNPLNRVDGMRKAGALAAYILQFAGSLIKDGLTTDELDRIVHEEILSHGAYPSPLLYRKFPKSICTSVNNVACHGIPDDRQLQDGDIISVDITVFYHGYHGDTSATYLVGNVDEEGQRLVQVAKECRDVGIRVCRAGAKFCEIGQAISTCVECAGFAVIPEFCGHGIGQYFHGPPDIIHVAYEDDARMKEGMMFTIEPIISEGSGEISILNDGWTAVTVDGSRCAQFEHTILVTKTGVEILTLSTLR